MPQIPDKRALGQIRVNGKATPASINPAVAYDIGRAGAAYERAFSQIAAAFSGLGEKQAAMEDAAWLSQAKIDTLTADDAIRRETDLNAGADGTGYEQAPMKLKGAIEDVEKRPGGTPEARTKYKLWAAEQGYETGRWAANTGQERLKTSTLDSLDKRLGEMTNLTSANPDKSREYFGAYEEEVRSKVGIAITAQDADARIEQARTNILKAGTIAKAIKNPADFGKAVGAIEGAAAAYEAENPETRAKPILQQKARVTSPISGVMETGQKDPLKGVAAINTNDSKGSHSYGNFGINSMGSAQQFQKKFGAQFGLTAKPGTAEFDKQWKNAAGASPVELHDAELEWWNETIGSKVVNNLIRVGVPSDIANDPRVVAYFADRSVQQGPGAIAKHASRVAKAWNKADGDPVKFLGSMSKADRASVGADFVSAMTEGSYSEEANNNRVGTRERLALEQGGGAPLTRAPRTAGEGMGVDISQIPQVAGTIQPQELLALSPRDYQAVVREMRPYLTTDVGVRVEKAVAALTAKGTQSLVKPGEIDAVEPLVGPKQAQAWREGLRDAEELYTVTDTVKRMPPNERRAQLAALVPTGNVEDLAEDETRRFEMWTKAIRTVETRITEDPLAYLSVENESGRQALKSIAAAEQGEAGKPMREQAYDTLIMLQKQEGVAPSKIRILGKEQSNTVASALREAKSGQAAVNILEGLRTTYGKHFNQAWGELVDAGAPDTYLAMTTATRNGQNALIESFQMEKAIGESATKGEGRSSMMRTRAGVSQAELGKAITSEISEFTQALEGGSSSPRLIEAYRDATERVALKYMVADGKSLDDAVRQASRDIFKDNAEVYKGVIVPRNEWDQRGSAIKDGLNSGIANMVDQHREMIVSPLVRDRSFGADYNQQRYVNSLKSNGRFVTNEDGTGVYLLDQFGNYVMTDTQDKGLQPLFFDWTAVSASPPPHRFGYPRNRFDLR